MVYPSRVPWRFRNVTQTFDFSPVLDSVGITQSHPDGITNLRCRVVKDAASLTFVDEDRVWVKGGTAKIWAGHLNIVGRGYLSRIGTRYWDLAGRDYTAKLDDSVITYQRDRPRETPAQRVAFILDHLNFPITTAGVDLPGGFVERANFENMSVEEALSQVDGELGTFHYIDYGPDDGGPPDLHMFLNESLAAPFDLDDDAPDYATTFPFGVDGVFERKDSSELATAIHVVGNDVRRWVPDYDQIATYGRQEMPITDSGYTTVAQVEAAGRRALNEHDRPKVEGEVIVWEPGLRAGMSIGVKSGVWGIDATRIITSVEITAPDGEDDSGEAMLVSRIGYADRRRLGRIPGGSTSRTRKRIRRIERQLPGAPSGGTGTTPPGGSEPPEDPDPPSQTDGDEHVLDDWTRVVTTHPVEIDKEVTTSTGTSHSVAIPAAVSDGRLLLLAYTTTEDANTIATQLTTLGWDQREVFTNDESTSGGIFAFYITAGNVGEVEDPIALTTPGSETILARVALIEAGPADGSGLSNDMQAGAATPGVSGFTGEAELAYVFGFDRQAVAGGGGAGAGYTLVDDLSATGTGLKVNTGNQTGAINPGDWTAGTGSQQSATLVIRFVEPGWGRIPFGRGVDHDGPWDGGNLYHPVIIGTATATVSSGVGTIAVTADGTSVSMVLRSDAPDDANGEVWGPWAEGAAALRYKWKVSALGDTADADPNLLDFLVITKDWRGRFRVHLGDAETYVYQGVGEERGIVVLQTASAVASDFITKILSPDTYYWVRMDFRDTRVRFKLWSDLADEPVAWDIDIAKTPEDLGEDDVKQLWLSVDANAGMTFSFDTSYAQIGVPDSTTEPGHADTFRGDGVTTTFTWRPWTGHIWLYVDGILTEPSATDPVLGTFTFSRAPAKNAYIIPLATTA